GRGRLFPGRVGVPPAVFGVSPNTPECLCAWIAFRPTIVSRKMRDTAGGTPTLPERIDAQSGRITRAQDAVFKMPAAEWIVANEPRAVKIGVIALLRDHGAGCNERAAFQHAADHRAQAQLASATQHR